jgi:glycosyltransferase involved in cell wall biosynthesis
MKRRVAIVGTQGVPANYGGFESLVENLIDSDKMDYTVYCSSKDMGSKLESYKGAKLKYIPLRANGVQSIPYDILSLISALWGYDVVLILGVSGAIFLPIFRLLSRAKVVTNVDGLEHRRAKWGKFARWFLKFSERCAVKFSHRIIADNQGIVDYLKEEYGAESELIAYGGDHVMQSVDADFATQVLDKYGVKPFEYSFALCRIEPENNCHIVLEAAAKSGTRLLFVGNWNRSGYGVELRKKFEKYENISLLDPIYDLKQLYVLRSNAARYIHGHSAGGTNPSLVEAMFFGREIFAFDVVYNRETTQNKALYFSDAESLATLLTMPIRENKELQNIANTIYTWSAIRDKYENLF